MNAFAETVGHWLADYYLLSTILLAVVLLAMLVMRQPARKLALTRATVAGLLLLAVLCALPEWSPVHLTEADPAPSPTPSVEIVKSEPVVVPPASVEARPADAVAPSVTSDVVEPEVYVPAVNATTPEPSAKRLNVAALLGGVFLVGSVLFAAWFALGLWHLGRICRESERAPVRVVSMLERIAGAVPLLPRLLLNDRLPSAVASGAWDTSILIPKQLADGAEDELTSVIAHEWAHVKNGDLRLLAASRLLMLLLWAHPLYWMLRVRMRLEQETLADAAAAEMTSRHDYAAHLVSWAKNMPAAPHQSLASAIGIWEGPSQLRRRIAVLLDEKLTVLRSCSWRWRWLAGSLCALMAVALSLITLRPASAHDALGAVEEEPDHAAPVSDDYQNFLGQWEVVSVAGKGGRFMILDDKTKPGARITIPHVHAPGPDFDGFGKVYKKSPFVTRWLSPEIEAGWAKDDSFHLYPTASPKRVTYKATDGKKPHFSDAANPPQYAIYGFDGDLLTLMIGDPADFEINEGQEVNQSSAGTPVKWKWKLVIPNYPDDFNLEPGEQQLLVKLRRVDLARGAGDLTATATGLAGGNSGDVMRAIYKESEALRGKTRSVEQKSAQYRVWLARLQAELDRCKDPAVRKSLSALALGYANGLGDFRPQKRC